MVAVTSDTVEPRDEVRLAGVRCPVCRTASLAWNASSITCSTATCKQTFPVVDGVPILINERESVFDIADIAARRSMPFAASEVGPVRRALRRLRPQIGKNVGADANFEKLAELLASRGSKPRILVIGGAIEGAGIRALSRPGFELVETDVLVGPRTNVVCDAHELPFVDASFDAVVAQAVLEHVVDPYRCVREIHRVLRPRGLVYAETPFIQQVHAQRFDFTRFTHLGHRRLFRHFAELESGAVCGPGMALGWSYQYFLLSFSTSSAIRRGLIHLSDATGFVFKQFDRHLVRKPGALDAASALYFLGERSEDVLSDRDLIRGYRGAF